jgi:CBS domain-containing protein
MQVKEVMTSDPACCMADTPLPEVARMMIDNDCGEIPVIDNKSSKVPIGVVTDRDIVCRTVANGLNPVELTAADCMSKPIVTVTADMSVEDCCRLMEEKLIRRVPVVDDRGSISGIVALADIALNAKKSTAAEVVKEVSEPTTSASAASAATR